MRRRLFPRLHLQAPYHRQRQRADVHVDAGAAHRLQRNEAVARALRARACCHQRLAAPRQRKAQEEHEVDAVEDGDDGDAGSDGLAHGLARAEQAQVEHEEGQLQREAADGVEDGGGNDGLWGARAASVMTNLQIR